MHCDSKMQNEKVEMTKVGVWRKPVSLHRASEEPMAVVRQTSRDYVD